MPFAFVALACAALIGFAAHRASLCKVRAVAEIMASGSAHMFWSLLQAVLWMATLTGVMALLFGTVGTLRNGLDGGDVPGTLCRAFPLHHGGDARQLPCCMEGVPGADPPEIRATAQERGQRVARSRMLPEGLQAARGSDVRGRLTPRQAPDPDGAAARAVFLCLL